MAVTEPGYVAKILRVDLTSGRLSEETVGEEKLLQYPGGFCLGARYLYDEVPNHVQWMQPENRFFLGGGPLSGTVIGGSVLRMGP